MKRSSELKSFLWNSVFIWLIKRDAIFARDAFTNVSQEAKLLDGK